MTFFSSLWGVSPSEEIIFYELGEKKKIKDSFKEDKKICQTVNVPGIRNYNNFSIKKIIWNDYGVGSFTIDKGKKMASIYNNMWYLDINWNLKNGDYKLNITVNNCYDLVREQLHRQLDKANGLRKAYKNNTPLFIDFCKVRYNVYELDPVNRKHKLEL